MIGRADVPMPGHFDVVIDVVGGPAWPSVIATLRPGGHYAVAGAIAGPVVEADLRVFYLNDITLHGCTFQPRAVFADLVGLINSGTVRPRVAATYPLARIGEAQAAFLSKQHSGKIVLLPPEVSA